MLLFVNLDLKREFIFMKRFERCVRVNASLQTCRKTEAEEKSKFEKFVNKLFLMFETVLSGFER